MFAQNPINKTDALIEAYGTGNTNLEKTILYCLNKYNKDYCKKLVRYAAHSANMEQCVETIKEILRKNLRDEVISVKNPMLKNMLINAIGQVNFETIAKSLVRQSIEGTL